MEVSLDKFSEAVNEILTTFSGEMQEKLQAAAEKIAQDGASELKTASPKRTGKYAKSWTTTTRNWSNGTFSVVVHNKKFYHLTHLLEHGHKKANGKGSVAAYPHIGAAEEKLIEAYMKEAEKIIGGNG